MTSLYNQQVVLSDKANSLLKFCCKKSKTEIGCADREIGKDTKHNQNGIYLVLNSPYFCLALCGNLCKSVTQSENNKYVLRRVLLPLFKLSILGSSCGFDKSLCFGEHFI